MSTEYSLAIALVIGGVLKIVGIEIDNSAIEGLIAGVVALIIAIKRYSKGDITKLGLVIFY
jgi:hypothetical protein